jgi:peptidyl-prolyl cis-trans isomerase A (cyclophilin A)
MLLKPVALCMTLAFLVVGCATEPPACPRTTDDTVVMNTRFGDITVELFPEQAPVTVQNFIAYVDSGFYDKTLFHRIIPDFVVQGGGLTTAGPKATRAPIENEADNGLLNERGTLSMARGSDPNSATSQFFINLKHNEILDHGVRDFGYAVFGRVVAGMDVVDQIAAVTTDQNDRPVSDVLLDRACRQ